MKTLQQVIAEKQHIMDVKYSTLDSKEIKERSERIEFLKQVELALENNRSEDFYRGQLAYLEEKLRYYNLAILALKDKCKNITKDNISYNKGKAELDKWFNKRLIRYQMSILNYILS